MQYIWYIAINNENNLVIISVAGGNGGLPKDMASMDISGPSLASNNDDFAMHFSQHLLLQQ